MTCAYDKSYLERARTTLGRMLDFAVNEMEYDLNHFFDLFIGSGLAQRFGSGDPALTVGKSGVELAYAVLEASGLENKRLPVRYAAGRSPEYWTGWALAYYQWRTALSFAEIAHTVKPSEVREMYPAFHEMDVRQFADRMDELYHEARPSTALQRRRMEAGLSQRQLAEQAGVPVRSIQQYEQRQKSIRRAAFNTVEALARALCCSSEDLVGQEVS